MTKQLDLKALIDGYTRNLDYIDQELSKLEKESETIAGQLQTRRLVQSRIEASQREIAALEGERSYGLMFTLSRYRRHLVTRP